MGSLDTCTTAQVGLFPIYNVFCAKIAYHVTLLLQFVVGGANCMVGLTFNFTVFFDLTGIRVCSFTEIVKIII